MMEHIKYIVEYKREGDREWRFYYGTTVSNMTIDFDRLEEKYEEAKNATGAAMVRIRKKIEQSQVIEEWKKENENG